MPNVNRSRPRGAAHIDHVAVTDRGVLVDETGDQNPAVERQATDRAYRIGQDKPVFVYKLIVEEGIEAAIEQLKARKAALAEALVAGASKAPLDLTEADISALFAPLDERAGAITRKRKAA